MKLGIVSDIHEDAENLEKAIAQLEQMNCDKIICLGDIVGFSYPNFGFYENRNASRCIDLIKSNCSITVAGNHDLYPVRRIPLHNAGFNYPSYWYQLDYHERKKLAGQEVWLNEENEFDPLLKPTDIDFLKQIPEFEVFEAETFNVLFSHYLFPDLTGSSRKFYEAFGPVDQHLEYIQKNKCKIGFSGHKHIEGIYCVTNTQTQYFEFGDYQIRDELQWIVGPCIANGKKENGFMIFDTLSWELKVIPLKSPKRMMQVVYI